jgi:hypothetical protein
LGRPSSDMLHRSCHHEHPFCFPRLRGKAHRLLPFSVGVAAVVLIDVLCAAVLNENVIFFLLQYQRTGGQNKSCLRASWYQWEGGECGERV